MKNIQFCFLQSHSTLENALKLTLGISKQKLKKFLSSSELKMKVQEKKPITLSLDIVNYAHINPHYQGANIDILYDDDILMALNKPARIHAHPLSYLEQNNLLSFLRESYHDQLLQVNVENYDRGLLYRLDYETSGLILYIKQQHIYEELRANFNSIMKNKVYLAMVKGKFSKLGKHAHFFSSVGEKGHKQKVHDSLGDFVGELTVVKAQYDQASDHSLVWVELKTGLRHQIRAQLAYLGFPILGDELYGGEKAGRLYLHAFEYAFETKTMKYKFQCPPDKLFCSFFDLNSGL